MINTQYSIEIARSSFPTLKITLADGRQAWLHSKYSPEQDASLFAANREALLGNSHIIILGCGLGYHLAGLFEKSDYQGQVFIIDYLPISTTDIRPIAGVKKNNLHIINGLSQADVLNKIELQLALDRTSKLVVLEHPASFRVFPEYYQTLKNKITEVIEKKVNSLNTVQHLGLQFLRNACINVARLESFRSPDVLRGFFKNYTFAILSSGPSLDSFLPWLKTHQEQVITIAADSALPVLQAWNLEPDFYISIDPQVWVHEHCHTLPARSVALTGINACHSIHHRHPFLFTGTHPVAQLVDHFAPGRFSGFDSSTGNVTGDAILAAKTMGASSIIIAGADFGFPEGTIYARGTMYQNRYAFFNQNRFNPVETQNMSYIVHSSRHLKHDNIATRRNFLDYRQHINNIVSSAACAVQHYTPHGLALPDAQHVVHTSELLLTHNTQHKNSLFTKLSTISPDINNKAIIVAIHQIMEKESVLNDLLTSSGVPASTGIVKKVRQWLNMNATCNNGGSK